MISNIGYTHNKGNMATTCKMGSINNKRDGIKTLTHPFTGISDETRRGETSLEDLKNIQEIKNISSLSGVKSVNPTTLSEVVDKDKYINSLNVSSSLVPSPVLTAITPGSEPQNFSQLLETATGKYQQTRLCYQDPLGDANLKDWIKCRDLYSRKW